MTHGKWNRRQQQNASGEAAEGDAAAAAAVALTAAGEGGAALLLPSSLASLSSPSSSPLFLRPSWAPPAGASSSATGSSISSVLEGADRGAGSLSPGAVGTFFDIRAGGTLAVEVSSSSQPAADQGGAAPSSSPAPAFSSSSQKQPLGGCPGLEAELAGAVTITNPDTTTGFALTPAIPFTTAGQSSERVAVNVSGTLYWRASRVMRTGVQAVVVGTTVLTGLCLAANYALSVTGTVSSTTTRGLPNGNAVGEQIVISVPTAASTPVGSISFLGTTLLGVAATSISAIGATTVTQILTWTGSVSGWQVMYNVGATIS